MNIKNLLKRILCRFLPYKTRRRLTYHRTYQRLRKSSLGVALKANASFKGIYKGKRCFILGNGPSLSEIDLSLLKDEITFTVNDLCYKKDFEALDTTYHVFADPHNYGRLEELLRKLEEKANPKGIFIESTGYEILKQQNLPLQFPIYVFANGIEVEDLSFMDIDLCHLLPYFCTVVQYAISIAAYMGFQEIYLVGCDFNGIFNCIDKLKEHKQKHYANELPKNENVKQPGIRISSEQIFFEWYHIFKSYRLLKDYLDKRKSKLINLTENSILDSLEKRKLKDVLKSGPLVPNDGWMLVIRPKSGWFDINLRELWQYRDLVWLFVKRNYSAMYKQTILGPLWFILSPLLTVIIFTIVFGNIAGISTDGIPKLLFYMSGNTLWSYFAYCLNTTATTFTNNAVLFGKVYFPRLTMPLSIVIFGLISFLIQFVMLIGFICYYTATGSMIRPNIYIMLIPILVLMVALLGLGFGIIFSSLTTKYRDLTILLSFGVQLWMYATPVVYPVSGLSATYKTAVLLNPMSSIIEAFRYALLGSGNSCARHLIYSAAVTVIILGLGIIIFSRVEKTFIDTV